MSPRRPRRYAAAATSAAARLEGHVRIGIEGDGAHVFVSVRPVRGVAGPGYTLRLASAAFAALAGVAQFAAQENAPPRMEFEARGGIEVSP